MTACMGEYTIEDIRWSGRHSLTVEIATELEDRYIQMYAGRRLVGVSLAAGALTVIGGVEPTHCPTPISIVLVDAADKNTNFGALLPNRPWNHYRMGWLASSYPADSRWFGIYSSSEADTAVDYETTLARVAYIGDGVYSFIVPAITACGDWTYGVASFDDAEPNGNMSTPAEYAIPARVYPPDVLTDDSGRRLRVSQDETLLTVGFDYDWTP